VPLTLLHGARGNVLESVLQDGLVPRGTSPGNWGQLVASRPSRVYMSRFVPLVYATSSTDRGPGWIFRVELPDSVVASGALAPDEDMIASTIGREEGWWNPAASNLAMDARMAELVRTIDPADFAPKWKDYYERSGVVSIAGGVAPAMITRYVRVDVGNVPEVVRAWNEFNARSGVPHDEVVAVLESFTASIMDDEAFGAPTVSAPISSG